MTTVNLEQLIKDKIKDKKKLSFDLIYLRKEWILNYGINKRYHR